MPRHMWITAESIKDEYARIELEHPSEADLTDERCDE